MKKLLDLLKHLFPKKKTLSKAEIKWVENFLKENGKKFKTVKKAKWKKFNIAESDFEYV